MVFMPILFSLPKLLILSFLAFETLSKYLFSHFYYRQKETDVPRCLQKLYKLFLPLA